MVTGIFEDKSKWKKGVVIYGYDGADLVPMKINADGELVVNLEAATINIGDVDVVSSALPTGAATSANQLAKVLTHVNIDFSDASLQTIVAAPAAGNRIRIAALELMALANVEVALISGSTTIGTYRGLAIVPNCQTPINLGAAEALKLDATSADRITGRVSYYVEAV